MKYYQPEVSIELDDRDGTLHVSGDTISANELVALMAERRKWNNTWNARGLRESYEDRYRGLMTLEDFVGNLPQTVQNELDVRYARDRTDFFRYPAATIESIIQFLAEVAASL